MAIRTVVTRGYGNGTFNGTIALVALNGYLNIIGPDTVVEPNAYTKLFITGGFGPYYSDINNGLIVAVDNTFKLFTYRTVDKGVIWTKNIVGSDSIPRFASYYDRETPGILADRVNYAYLNSDNGTFNYGFTDVSDGSESTVSTIASGLTVPTIADAHLSQCGITKTKSGNIIVAYSTQVEIDCLRSIDEGFSFQSINDIYELGTQEDFILLFPANTSDDDDACGIFWDRNVNEISIKMWDNNTGTWTETLISANMSEAVRFFQMDATVRHSDGKILLVAWSEADNVAADILSWEIDPNSISTPTIVSKTNIVTDLAESASVTIWINQLNNEIRVGYLKGGTWQSDVDAVYKVSTDGMLTWSSEKSYSQNTADDLRFMHSGRTSGINGGRYQPSFFNDDLNTVSVNLDNDLGIKSILSYLLKLNGVTTNSFSVNGVAANSFTVNGVTTNSFAVNSSE